MEKKTNTRRKKMQRPQPSEVLVCPICGECETTTKPEWGIVCPNCLEEMTPLEMCPLEDEVDDA